MKIGFSILFLIQFGCLIISCSSINDPDQKQMEGFNSYIGESQAKALGKAIQSFDVFLAENFSEYPTESARVKAFLLYVKDSSEPKETWKFNTQNDSIIILDFEKSGLRKEIWLYGYEVDTMELDSEVLYFYNPFKEELSDNNSVEAEEFFTSLEMALEEDILFENDSIYEYEAKLDSIHHLKMATNNSRSKIPFVMNKFPVTDSTINGYIDLKHEIGSVSPAVVAHGLLWRDVENYSKPYFKIIIVTEMYYYLMRWNLNRNGIYIYPKD